MYINQVYELSMVFDNERFQKVFNRACRKNQYMEENEDEYIDKSLSSNGITVIYRDSQYKKKVKLIAEPRLLLDGKQTDSDRIIRKLDKRIREYFDFKYNLGDFDLSGVTLATDIDVRSRKNVSAYLKVLQRVGKVKGYSPAEYDCFEDVDSFCLDGNSNHLRFFLYDLKGLLDSQFRNSDIEQKKFKAMSRETEGILRAEIRLAKPKAVRIYTDAANVYGQLAGLTQKSQEIFLDVFMHIVPFGNYYKKDKAVELVRENIDDSVLRRRMLHLLALVPEKKSLYPAQKAMNCRDIEKAGVKMIRVHDLRHSHVAYLIHQGVPPLVIKERLGHKDIGITLNTYGHLYPNEQKKLAEMLNGQKEKKGESNKE